MTEPQTWTSVIIPSLALLAVITLGVLNLRRASLGPKGAPRWTLRHANKQRFELLQDGTAAARDVRVDLDGGSRMNGVQEFDCFEVGQRASFVIATSLGGGSPRLRVTWAGPRRWHGSAGARREWSTDLP